MTDVGKAWMYREAVSKLSLKALLEESSISWLQVSKEHKEDQIYALLGLATDADQLGITIDYSIPWEQTYTEVAMTYLVRSDLWFLNHVQGTIAGRSRHLPSWVPDWSVGYRGARVNQHWSPPKTHLGTLEAVIPPKIADLAQRHILGLRGVIGDEVAWVSTERFQMSVNQLNTPLRKKLYQWIRALADQCSDKHSRREIWNVLISNSIGLPLPESFNENTSEERKRQYLNLVFDSILEEDTCEDPLLRPIIETWLTCFMQATSFKCIYQTTGGRLGIGPVGIKQGDRICAFMGNETAFILRPVALTSEQTRHRLMCETYVHKFMDAKGLREAAKVEDIILE